MATLQDKSLPRLEEIGRQASALAERENRDLAAASAAAASRKSRIFALIAAVLRLRPWGMDQIEQAERVRGVGRVVVHRRGVLPGGGKGGGAKRASGYVESPEGGSGLGCGIGSCHLGARARATSRQSPALAAAAFNGGFRVCRRPLPANPQRSLSRMLICAAS